MSLSFLTVGCTLLLIILTFVPLAVLVLGKLLSRNVTEHLTDPIVESSRVFGLVLPEAHALSISKPAKEYKGIVLFSV